MHKNALKCVWEKTPPLSGKNPTPSPWYNPRQPGGIERQMTEFPLASHYYREGYHYRRITNRNHLSLHQQRLDGSI